MSDLATPTPTAETRTETRWGARSIASLLLFVLAAVLTVPALVGHWGHRTVIDSERYIETVGPLIDQPEVQQALATAVTDAVVAKVDTENQVSTLLGNLFGGQPALGQLSSQLAAPIASGINSLIGELVTKFVASDQFRTVWIQLNTAAQKGIVLVLEGKDGGIVSLQGDDLVLDTSTALQSIQSYLVDSGITAAANITIPETDREIVLANTPGLAQIRTIYSFTSPILRWFPLIIAIMFGAAILLARRRARTTVWTGVVLGVSGFVVLLGLGVGETEFTNALAGTPWEPAANVFWSTLLDYLVAGARAIIALGVVLVLAGWFGGRTGLAVRVRGAITTGLADLGGRLSGGRPGTLPRPYLPWAHILIYAVGTAILLFSGLLAVSTVLWVTALVAGLVTLAQLLAGPEDAGSAAGDSVGAPPEAGAVTAEASTMSSPSADSTNL